MNRIMSLPAVVRENFSRGNRAPTVWAITLTVLFLCGSLLPRVTFFSTSDGYLPFHMTLEFISISVSFMVFALAWNLRKMENNSQIIILGVFALAVGLIDLVHTFSFSGMPDFFTPSSPEKAIYFWIAGRLLAAIALLLVAILPPKHWTPRLFFPLIAVVFVVVGLVTFIGVDHPEWFPHTFIDGQGLTAFKIGVEYVITTIYFVAAAILLWRRKLRSGIDSRWLAAAAWTLGLAELFFTMYASVTDTFNMLGHVYKVIAYLMIYRAIFAAGVQEPYRQLETEKARLRSVIDSIPDLIVLKNNAGHYVGANRAFTEYTGYTEDDLAQMNSENDFHGVGITETDTVVLSTGAMQRFHKWIPRATGDPALFDTVETAYSGPDGETLGLIEVSRDITEQHKQEELLIHMALHDQLTGLPNRAMLAQTSKDLLTSHPDTVHALLYIDLDDFKTINDTLGYSVGDLVLKETCARLLAICNESETVARLGGDEFAVLLVNTSVVDSAEFARKIMETVGRPYHISGYELTLTPSIGITVYPEDGSDFETLSQGADAAMSRAKHEEHNTFRFYGDDVRSAAEARLRMKSELRKAVEENQFVVYYQPQVQLSTGITVGAEALVRWQHPERGLIYPKEFIPLAEETGVILAIGEWVLRQALQDANAWPRINGVRPSVSVNLSAVQFLQNDMAERISEILDEECFPAECLDLEITESVAMHNPDTAAVTLERLKKLGVMISIDDFGTGYSSMAYLRRFRVNRLKIDQSFVSDMNTDDDAAAIVTAVIQLAKALRCETLAEGVETIAEYDLLTAQGCETAQGYLFSRAIPSNEMLNWMTSRATMRPTHLPETP